MFFEKMKEYFYKNTKIVLYYRFIQSIFVRENNKLKGITSAVILLYPPLVGVAWHQLYLYKRVPSNYKMRGMRFERMNLYRNGS
jgi:hypothetical protein